MLVAQDATAIFNQEQLNPWRTQECVYSGYKTMCINPQQEPKQYSIQPVMLYPYLAQPIRDRKLE